MNDTPGTELVPTEQFADVRAVSVVQRALFLPATLKEAMDMAHFMARGIGVRPWMRNEPSACLMVLQQAMRWGMDPYAVAQKAYYTNDTLCFESQLVNAVINTSGMLERPLKIEWAGTFVDKAIGQETLVCRVTGWLKSAPDEERVLEQPLCDVKIRNSPLWKVNPHLQLAYHTTRSWARLYMPEVLLGVYTPDEIVEGETARIEQQTAPAAGKAPDRRNFAENQPVDAEIVEIDEETAENGAEDAADSDTGRVSEPLHAENDAADDAVQSGGGDVGPESAADSSERPVEKPSDPGGWTEWERELTDAIEHAADESALRVVIAVQGAVLDDAPQAVQDRIDEVILDKRIQFQGAGE